MYYGERFNAHTHLAGTVLAIGGSSALVATAAMKADPVRLVSFSLYGATLCFLFLISTLYHSTQGEAKNLFRKLDHCAIYLLMGWLAIFALEQMAQALSWNGVAWVVSGGVVYTVGILFYLYDERFTHWHGIWHLFVLAGSIAHYTAIVLFVA